ncbi:MAG: hypothetical protein ABSD89_13245 [Halobacteriota archaeon]|jgi:hypothetical protein
MASLGIESVLTRGAVRDRWNAGSIVTSGITLCGLFAGSFDIKCCNGTVGGVRVVVHR